LLENIIISSMLAALIMIMAVVYSKRIREARREYLKAKDAIDDIMLSFNRQLRLQEEHLGITAQRIGVLSSRDDVLAEELEGQKGAVKELTDKVKSFYSKEDAVARIHSVEDKLDKFRSLRETLEQRIIELEKGKLSLRESETRVESAIPIRREKALAQLTETELLVLEFLAAEGKKTAPETKDKVKLSREHTARLMKKLYEKGYLERSSNKIPFTYRLKEEMQRFLKRPEQKN
jgi:hypothetical protein